MTIRPCDKSDIEELLKLAIDCYPKFDVESSRLWLTKNIENPDVFVAIGKYCAGLAFIAKPFYQPSKANFELEFVCSRKTRFGAIESLNLVRFFNDLRRSKGYDRMWVNSRLADLEPLILRLGGKVGGKSWILEG